MINRKIDFFLTDFFSLNPHKSLLITGARQIGKTFSIRNYGKKNYKHFIEINFIEHPELIDIFTNAKSSESILLRLSVATNEKLEKNDTLIFFDEVQRCPEIITAIKFLVDEGSYSYILSGSLLGVELKDIRSVPVGYMSLKEMFPLDFEEFAEACGIKKDIIENLKHCFEQEISVDDFIHKKMMELFRLYLIVGGMPAAVETYVQTNNLQKVTDEQNQIIIQYKKDISQYDKENKLYIEEIFSLIPPELNSKNKRFILKKLNENIKFSRYENSFLWLKDAGAALPVYNVEEPIYPLLLSRSRNLFKLFLADIGLLASQYSNGFQLKILNNEVNINFGAIYENAVAQELKTHGFDLYYFNSKKQCELDFIIEYNDSVLPIEVKSGKDYERHNALKNVMENSDYKISKAFVLCNDNLKVEKKIIYLPVYMVMFMHKNQNKDLIYKIDLSEM